MSLGKRERSELESLVMCLLQQANGTIYECPFIDQATFLLDALRIVKRLPFVGKAKLVFKLNPARGIRERSMLLMFSKYDGSDDVWFDEEERVYLSFPKLAAATVWHQVSKWMLQVEVDASHLMWDREWFDAEEENSALELHHWRICLIETLDNLLETLEDKENNP